MNNEQKQLLSYVRALGQRFILPPDGTLLPRRAYRIRDLMVMLGLPKSTLHDMIRRGDLRAVAIGTGRRKLLLVPAEAVERLLSLPEHPSEGRQIGPSYQGNVRS